MTTRKFLGVLVIACIATPIGVKYVQRRERELRLAADPLARTRYIKEWRLVANEGHADGDSNASVVVVTFTDYECPYCRRFEATLVKLFGARQGTMKLVRRHFPLDAIHPFARQAAIASECAGREGKFLAYHNMLYAEARWIGVAPWTEFATKSGIGDTLAFQQCVEQNETAAIVEHDVLVGRRLEITGTPTFLVNDSLYVGARSARDMEKILTSAMLERRVR